MFISKNHPVSHFLGKKKMTVQVRQIINWLYSIAVTGNTVVAYRYAIRYETPRSSPQVHHNTPSHQPGLSELLFAVALLFTVFDSYENIKTIISNVFGDTSEYL